MDHKSTFHKGRIIVLNLEPRIQQILKYLMNPTYPTNESSQILITIEVSNPNKSWAVSVTNPNDSGFADSQIWIHKSNP
jgi:hypothetical protein